MTIACVLAVLLAAAPPPPSPPPPPPPSSDDAVPPLPLSPPPFPSDNAVPPIPVPQTARVHVRLNAVPPGSELYDVTAVLSLCRAPCGVWLDPDDEHLYQVRGDGIRESAEFGLGELKVGSTIDVDYTPRDDTLWAVGLGLTIAGGVGFIGGVVLTVIWLYAMLIVNAFSALFGGSGLVVWIEMLYAAAVCAVVGIPMLAVGVPLLIKSRPRLDVREARPVSETPGAR